MCTHANRHQCIKITFVIRFNDIHIDMYPFIHCFMKYEVKFTKICLYMVFYGNTFVVVIQLRLIKIHADAPFVGFVFSIVEDAATPVNRQEKTGTEISSG